MKAVGWPLHPLVFNVPVSQKEAQTSMKRHIYEPLTIAAIFAFTIAPLFTRSRDRPRHD